MKRKKAALYSPYLDVLGGGERHILSILKVLEENNYDLTIFWDENLQDDIKTRLNLSFDYLVNFEPNIFNRKGLFKKINTLRKFDHFFYVTDGSYFFSSAINNFVFCMVPRKELYNMNPVNRTKTSNYRFIANSKFTQGWLKKWGVKSDVIYPYIDPRFLLKVVDPDKKEKVILAVGRFFGHLHSKKQEVLIEIFKELKHTHPEFKNFKLVMAGGLKEEDKPYFEKLKKAAGKDKSVILKTNISHDELFNLYENSAYFWHFAGHGVNENKSPEKVEHLGITPLEAMAMGCITFCYRAGGPKAYIKDERNGFLFQSKDELIKKMVSTLKNKNGNLSLAKSARETVRRNFSYSAFRQNVEKLILLIK